MGQCFATPEEKRRITPEGKYSIRLEREIGAHYQQRQQQFQVLFLGSPSESAIFLRHINDIFEQKSEKKSDPLSYFSYKSAISSATVQAIKSLSSQISDSKDDDKEALSLKASSKASKEFVDALGESGTITPEIAFHARVLWQDDAIQTAFSRMAPSARSNCEYYMKNVLEYCKSGYEPTFADVAHLPVDGFSGALYEKDLIIEGNQFHFMNATQQRNERRKWLHSFEVVTGVVFCAPLGCFDEEVEDFNKLMELLRDWDSICNCRWFKGATTILFLTEMDVLKDKLSKGVKFNRYFLDYSGDNSFESVLEYIRRLFLDKNLDPSKMVYQFEVVVADKSNVEKVILAVRVITLRTTLMKMGLA